MGVALVNTSRRAGAADKHTGVQRAGGLLGKGMPIYEKKKRRKEERRYVKGPRPALEEHAARLPLRVRCFPVNSRGASATGSPHVSLKRVIKGCLLITERPLQHWSHTLINEYDVAIADMLRVLMRRPCCAAAAWAE